jgi:hypothetical protein
MVKLTPSLQCGNLTNAQRARIAQYKINNPRTSNSDVADWAKKEFKLAKSIDRTTVGRITKKKSRYENLPPQDQSIKRLRTITNDVLERALVNWVLQMEHQKLRISIEIIKEKGKQFATTLNIVNPPKFSNGWGSEFCKRNNFKQFRSHGESGDAQMDGVEDQLAILQERFKVYSHRDIYNMDETGLFYNLAPDKTISRRQIEGAKKDKTRITIGFTCNADGSDKVEPFFIGHANRPLCFKNAAGQRKTGEELGYFYQSNKKAWMTGGFFKVYLQHLSKYINGRKILLLIDNAPSHIFDKTEFPNIEILCLPPNTTSKLQPMDAGIIASFKCHYRKRQLRHALDALDVGKSPYKINQLQAMQWAREAWFNLDQSVLVNCWRHTTLLSDSANPIPPVDTTVNNIDEELIETYNQFLQVAEIQSAMPISDFINPPDEEQSHELLTDAEILEAAVVVDHDDGQDEAEAEAPMLYSELSKLKQVTALAKSIAICEMRGMEGVPINGLALTVLKRIQQDIRWEMMEEKRAKSKQTSITQYFFK